MLTARTHSALVLVVAAALMTLGAVAACGPGRQDPPPPGHGGPVPGPAAQAALVALAGAELPAPGGGWTVGPWGVVPNPRTGKGPVVRLTRGDEERWFPVLFDADAGDLEARVGRARTVGSAGPLSAEYRRALAELE